MIAMRLARPASIETHPLERVELPSLRPGPHELLLRVTACGRLQTGRIRGAAVLQASGAAGTSRSG